MTIKPLSVLGLALVIGASTLGHEARAQELNLYSSRHYNTDEALYENFTAETGIRVNRIEASGDALIERISSEGRNSPADLFITVDAGRLWRAEEAGLFQPIESDILESAVPAKLQHPDNLWFGLTQRVRVIVYNTDTVDPSELSTYEALAGPEWEGRVCIRSSSNVYNQSLVASLIDKNGADATGEWAEGMVSNFAREPEGGDTDQIKAVSAGVCDVAVSNHYYYARLLQSDKPGDRAITENTAMFFPNQAEGGTHANISGAGLVANAPNKEAAIKFLEYLVSPEAQEMFAKGNNEYPVVDGVDVGPAVDSLGEFDFSDASVYVFGPNAAEALELMDRAGWK
ncbi:MAG: Fe(3+) ABC transporter substrate-binding protein [Cyanobacteria bacterium P01_D01_bin.123]